MAKHYDSILEGFSFSRKREIFLRQAGDTLMTRVYLYPDYAVDVIRDAVKAGNATIKEAKWLDHRLNNVFYNDPDFLKENTYRESMMCELELSNLTAMVTFHDGNMCNGRPIRERCQWSINLDEALCEQHFSTQLDAELHDILDRAYEDERLKAKAERMRGIFIELNESP